jgi:hypothetical protein
MADDKFVQNIEWQIPRRAKIQDIMLRQFKLFQHPSFSSGNSEHYYPMMRMVQGTFSLWRSLFLSKADNNPDSICADAQKMLGTLLQSNAYSFQNDLRDRTFTGAYYNTNARYRIERLCDHDVSFRTLPSVQNLLQVRVDDFETRRTEMDMWELCFEALKDCFDQFETRLLSIGPSSP